MLWVRGSSTDILPLFLLTTSGDDPQQVQPQGRVIMERSTETVVPRAQ